MSESISLTTTGEGDADSIPAEDTFLDLSFAQPDRDNMHCLINNKNDASYFE